MDFPVPIACSAEAIPASERDAHFALAAKLFDEAVAERSGPDGRTFLVPAEQLMELARFVENERKCCPFLRFTIEVSGGEGPIRVHVAGWAVEDEA